MDVFGPYKLFWFLPVQIFDNNYGLDIADY